MKRKIFITIFLSLAIAFNVKASNLFNYYNDLGLNLPSIEERAITYRYIDSDNYTGSLEQNIKLLDYFNGENYLGNSSMRKMSPFTLDDPNLIPRDTDWIIGSSTIDGAFDNINIYFPIDR